MARKPMSPFHYLTRERWQQSDDTKAVVDMKGGIRFQGFFAWYVWMFVHLMSLVVFRNKVFTFLSWMWITFRLTGATG